MPNMQLRLLVQELAHPQAFLISEGQMVFGHCKLKDGQG
jgi:hypothetical protein